MAAAAALYAVSAGLDILSGIYGFFAADTANDMYQSRARLIRMEAEANAQRYMEQSRAFIGSQIAGYAASGVKITGSPIDVFAESARVARANVAAIRAGGAAEALEQELMGQEALAGGRASLIGGFAKGVGQGANAWSSMDRVSNKETIRNAQNPSSSGGGYTDSTGFNWSGSGYSLGRSR